MMAEARISYRIARSFVAGKHTVIRTIQRPGKQSWNYIIGDNLTKREAAVALEAARNVELAIELDPSAEPAGAENLSRG